MTVALPAVCVRCAATLRSRVVTEFEAAGGLALIPGIDLFNHSGAANGSLSSI